VVETVWFAKSSGLTIKFQPDQNTGFVSFVNGFSICLSFLSSTGTQLLKSYRLQLARCLSQLDRTFATANILVSSLLNEVMRSLYMYIRVVNLGQNVALYQKFSIVAVA